MKFQAYLSKTYSLHFEVWELMSLSLGAEIELEEVILIARNILHLYILSLVIQTNTRDANCDSNLCPKNCKNDHGFNGHTQKRTHK